MFHWTEKASSFIKALRVTQIPFGEFADYSINLPDAIWDEILNQVVCLLSV